MLSAFLDPASVQTNELLFYMTKEVSFRKKLYEVYNYGYLATRFGPDLLIAVERSEVNACETFPKFSGENFGHLRM